MEVTIKTDQIKILEDFFQGLSTIDQRKIFLAGFRKAAVPLISAAKAASPVRTGTLRRSFGAISIPQEIAILVGARKSGANKGWHGHLVENGTVQRFRKTKGGAPTGKVTGTHFFENAFNMVQEEINGIAEYNGDTWLTKYSAVMNNMYCNLSGVFFDKHGFGSVDTGNVEGLD